MNKTENLLVSIHLIAHRKKTTISVEQLLYNRAEGQAGERETGSEVKV